MGKARGKSILGVTPETPLQTAPGLSVGPSDQIGPNPSIVNGPEHGEHIHQRRVRLVIDFAAKAVLEKVGQHVEAAGRIHERGDGNDGRPLRLECRVGEQRFQDRKRLLAKPVGPVVRNAVNVERFDEGHDLAAEVIIGPGTSDLGRRRGMLRRGLGNRRAGCQNV
jgi:hypothetical protein